MVLTATEATAPLSLPIPRASAFNTTPNAPSPSTPPIVSLRKNNTFQSADVDNMLIAAKLTSIQIPHNSRITCGLPCMKSFNFFRGQRWTRTGARIRFTILRSLFLYENVTETNRSRGNSHSASRGISYSVERAAEAAESLSDRLYPALDEDDIFTRRGRGTSGVTDEPLDTGSCEK